MLGLLLKLLSIIGIVLLSLLVILIVVILVVLFCPISYKIKGTKNQEETAVKLKVNWLLGLLRVRFYYPDEGYVVVKFLFFKIFDSSPESQLKREQKKERKALKQAEKKENKSEVNTALLTYRQEEKERLQQNAATTVNSNENTNPTNEETQKKNLFLRIKEKFEGIKEKIIGIKGKINDIIQKIKNVLGTFSFYKSIWDEPDTKALLSHVWLRVKKILTKVFPRKINCNLVVGTGAPDTTGYIYAVYGIILSFLRKKDTLYIEPDFEEARLEGNINAKGHFMIITFVFNGLKILFDKKLHSLRRKLKKKPVELNA